METNSAAMLAYLSFWNLNTACICLSIFPSSNRAFNLNLGDRVQISDAIFFRAAELENTTSCHNDTKLLQNLFCARISNKAMMPPNV